MLDSRLYGGIRAFNRGQYFLAHELWESVWREAVPPEKGYYQGLIQAAMALYHLERGNFVGATRLAQRALNHLNDFHTRYLGLDTSQVRQFLLFFLKDDIVESARHDLSDSKSATGKYQAYPCLILCADPTENVEDDNDGS